MIHWIYHPTDGGVIKPIPRLELLAALILTRLITRVRSVLADFVQVSYTKCWSVSKVASLWIWGERVDWKQFVQKQVLEIRSLNCIARNVEPLPQQWKLSRYPFTRNVSYSPVGRNVVQWSWLDKVIQWGGIVNVFQGKTASWEPEWHECRRPHEVCQ